MSSNSLIIKNILLFSVGIYILIALGQCASPSPPSGGPRDESPPVLDTLKSSPLMPVFFEEREIRLEFDEFVELNNPATSVVVSPPLQHRLDFLVRGRRIVLSFDEREELRPNTTYTINFGDAIRDFTEGNVVKNFIYVFSTGPEIDSLEFSLRLIDAYTGEPVNNAFAMLHQPDRDSALLKQKPLYFAASGEDGTAQLQFLQEGEYALFALADENRNYLYDLPSERVGWLDGVIELPDTIGEIPEIRMFKRDERFGATLRQWLDGGRLALKFNRRYDAVEVEFPGLEIPPVRTISKDTLVFHFTESVVRDSVTFVVSLPPDIRDTMAVRPPRDTLRKALRLVSHTANIRPGQSAVLSFNQLLESVDTARIIQFRADTLYPYGHGVSNPILDKNQWNFSVDLESNQSGEWLLLPGAISDIYGESNDSIRFRIGRQPSNSFSNLNLRIDELDSAMQYIFIIENRSGEVFREVVSGLHQYLWEFRHIRPDNYTLRIVEDANFNRRWDPGDILNRRQPERVSVHPVVELRANWDFEQTVKPFN
ncbi:MAG: hypothetical protein EA409_04255 [Saprospirales bacterium]|nr:MAG: hypothetical protein EA409_04255 [Saprospirales bacterium]